MSDLNEASDPATDPKRLTELADHNDLRVLRRLAMNPNTPMGILDRLSKNFADAVTENPALQIALLGDMSALSTWQYANNLFTHTTPEWLIPYVSCISFDMRMKVINVYDLSSALFEILIQDPQVEIRKGLASRPYLTRAQQIVLAGDHDPDVRAVLASNSYAEEDILIMLAQDKDWYTKQKVARHKRTPVHILEMLSCDPDEEVRDVVAENPRTPEIVLIKLSNDRSQSVRLAVATNRNTPNDVLLILENDPVTLVSNNAAAEIKRREQP
jgi:hypothetical protein